jgi:hypothetical protein
MTCLGPGIVMLRSGMAWLFGTSWYWQTWTRTKRRPTRGQARLASAAPRVAARDRRLFCSLYPVDKMRLRTLPRLAWWRKEAVLQRPSPSPWIARAPPHRSCRRWSLEEKCQDDMHAYYVTRWVKFGIQKIVPLRKRSREILLAVGEWGKGQREME